MEQLTKELSTAADLATLEAAMRHAPSDRIVKMVAPVDDLLAVGYWGGMLQVLGKNGEVKNSELLPQDITGLAWLDGKLIAGLADGRLLALIAE
jgi:hypothetical protein